ncbi:MAG: CPBP family intramembrane metalloprotease [Bacilli bacterium]|jgi:membrane protease YdiL (CAAX protease family)|nr:CPBP family intramembrane metalloprotease [Bacilli bacterium]
MKETKKQPIYYILIGILLILSYQLIFPAIIYMIFPDLAKTDNPILINLFNIGYTLFTVLFFCILYRKSLKEEGKEFLKNKKAFAKKGIQAWLKGLGTMILSNLIVISIAGSMAGNEIQNRDILAQYPYFAVISMCLFGPFIEEIVFRKSFRKAFQNKYVFAIVTSFIFASLHVLNGFEELTLTCILNNWTQLLFLFPYGSLAFFFALAYYDTDNIFTSTLAHCLHNTFTILLVFLTR